MEPTPTQAPRTIGRFRVDAVLGRGGMGEVYKAFDPTLQRVVAVKTVRPGINSPEYLDRLFREAQACARLRHPNVVTVHEAGEIDGVVYMVMEYLTGEDLAAVLRRGDLTLDGKLRILMQILDALQHAHREDVIHRDIKPSNVYRQSDGSIKLVDFGLARVLEAETLTLTGAIMATPHYASPEQLRGEPVDERTDIYSTGVLAYEMLTGRRPFESETGGLTAVILKVISDPPPSMDVLVTRAFPAIEGIVLRAMAKRPEDRFLSAEEMRQAVGDVLASSGAAIAAFESDLQVSQARSALDPTQMVGATTVSGPARPDSRPAAVLSTSQTTIAAGGAARATSVVDTQPETAADATTAAVSRPASRNLWWLGLGAAAVIAVGVMLTWPKASAESAAGATTTTTAPLTSSPAASGTSPVPAAVTPKSNASPSLAAAPATNTAAVTPGDTPAALLSAAAAAPAPTADNVGAKQLFVGVAGSPANAGLRYRLTRQIPDGTVSDVDPATTVFQSGDRVRFSFDSNIDGYLYVVQQGSSGRWGVLFPDPKINGGRNAIRKGEEYRVPQDDWFLFDATPGAEQVFVFLSREPLNELPGFNRPVSRPETVVASVIENLQQRVRSRDLVFEKDRRPGPTSGTSSEATYVVNRSEVGQAVSASITLSHRQ